MLVTSVSNSYKQLTVGKLGKMGWLKSLLGIEELEKRIIKIEKKMNEFEKFHSARIGIIENAEEQILKILTTPMSTSQIAKEFKKSRSWASLLLNKLEREGKAKESGKRGRSVLYEKV